MDLISKGHVSCVPSSTFIFEFVLNIMPWFVTEMAFNVFKNVGFSILFLYVQFFFLKKLLLQPMLYWKRIHYFVAVPFSRGCSKLFLSVYRKAAGKLKCTQKFSENSHQLAFQIIDLLKMRKMLLDVFLFLEEKCRGIN